jgi:glycosyltransferase involved in cell wall biosynthesis
MKLFLIIGTLTQGGSERVISELANEFARQRKEVHLVLFVKSNDFYKLHPDIRMHRLGFRNNGAIQRIASELQTFYKLRKLLKKQKPDAVLSFLEKENILTILASRFLHLKVFVSDRSNPKRKKPKQIAFLKWLSYKFAAGVIAQTSLAKEILEKTTKNKNIKVIPNPLKSVKLYPEIKREKYILNIGRLIPEKGQKYLLEAFVGLNVPDWKLVILGDGPLRCELINQAKQLHIDHQLLMPGVVNNVDDWFARSSIFAFPSISEGFPNALAEAMAAGLPCVSFDCDIGPRDLINDRVNGILIDVYDVEEFSKNIALLINSPEKRELLGYEAMKIKDKLEITKISQAYLDFLQSP